MRVEAARRGGSRRRGRGRQSSTARAMKNADATSSTGARRKTRALPSSRAGARRTAKKEATIAMARVAMPAIAPRRKTSNSICGFIGGAGRQTVLSLLIGPGVEAQREAFGNGKLPELRVLANHLAKSRSLLGSVLVVG